MLITTTTKTLRLLGVKEPISPCNSVLTRRLQKTLISLKQEWQTVRLELVHSLIMAHKDS